MSPVGPFYQRLLISMIFEDYPTDHSSLLRQRYERLGAV